MRNLVKRYVAAMIRDAKTEEGLTEENFKELKQDISSFRFEVLGLLKGNKLNIQPKIKGASSLPDEEEKPERRGKGKGLKNNLSLFDITTMIHPRSAAIAADRFNSVSNGSALAVTEPAKEKKKTNFVKEIKNFGLFHRRSKSNYTDQSSNKIYSVSEEVACQEVETSPSDSPEVENYALNSQQSTQAHHGHCELESTSESAAEIPQWISSDNGYPQEFEKEAVLPDVHVGNYVPEELLNLNSEPEAKTETNVPEDCVTTRL